MAPPKRGSTHLIIALLLINRPRKDERLSWEKWQMCVSNSRQRVEVHWNLYLSWTKSKKSSSLIHQIRCRSFPQLWEIGLQNCPFPWKPGRENWLNHPQLSLAWVDSVEIWHADAMHYGSPRAAPKVSIFNSLLTQSPIVPLRSNLVQSLITWQPIHYKCSKS